MTDLFKLTNIIILRLVKKLKIILLCPRTPSQTVENQSLIIYNIQRNLKYKEKGNVQNL